jgi:hypothetical protein
VVAHRAGVALTRVPLADRPQLRLRRRGRPRHAGRRDRAQSEPRPRAAIERRRLPRVEHLHHGGEIVDLELAADIGAADAELARRAQGVRDRAGRPYGERRNAPRGRRDDRSVPEPDFEGT